MAFTISSTVAAAQILTTVTDVGVITSNGALVTGGSAAVSISGNGAFFVNDGLVASISFCLNATANFPLMNRGLMTTENTCINISIAAISTTTAAITNAGDIASTMSSAIVCADAGLTIQNSGLISGRSTAINLTSTDLTALNRINNSGIIEVQPTFSTDNAIVCNGIMRLVNTGTIFGVVNLGDGNDRVDNRGGMITGEIQLDDGINLFLGGAFAERVVGGGGLDTIRGDGGDDEVFSGSGDDLITGGAGDDSLHGGSGLDTIRAGAGDDTLTGSGETDILHGGTGRDTFAFTASGDSDTAQPADRIEDFKRGEDLIDLSFFAPATFAFVGTGPFTGGGTASFGISKVAGTVLVQADLNGDGTADFHIEVLGANTLTLADFLL